MVKLSERSRKVLRRIYQGLGATAISVLFQACYGPVYGPPMDDDILIQGRVSSKTQVPIPGIRVSVEDSPTASFTNQNGNFSIYVPEQISYILQFKDVDGPLNGSYKTLVKTINSSDAKTTLEIQLNEADEE